MRPASLVRWPSGLEPEGAAIYARNELEMRVTPEAVWPWLLRATLWPSWYSNAWRVRIVGGGDDLALGTRFHWVTFGIPVTTEIVEFEPCERLGWSGSGLGARGHHAWVIEPTPSGCRVVTEETQRGIAPRMGRFLLRPGLLHFHQRWLEALERKAAGGPPPPVQPR